MEAKKNPKADLGQLHGLIFSASLLISLALVSTAFNWKQKDKSSVDLTTKSVNTFETLVEIPPTDIPEPPPAVMVTQPRLVEVPDEATIEQEVKVDFDVEVNENTKVQDIIIQPQATKIEPEDTEEIFVVVEQVAAPKNGLPDFYKKISEKLHYPAQARQMGVEGKVFVEFVVNKDGSLTDFVVARGIGAGCDEEAVRIIQNGPSWNPAKQRGKPVRQRMVLPVFFKLADKM